MGTVRKRGKKYYAEVCIDGKRKGKTHPTKKKANDWIINAEAGAVALTSSNITLSKLVGKYIEEVVCNHKGAKQEEYRLKLIVKELPDIPISKLSQSDFSTWKQTKLKTVSPPTVRRYMSALNSVFSHAMTEWHAIDHNPLKGVKKPPSAPPRERVPDDDEIEEVLLELGYVEDQPVMTHQQQIGVSLLFAVETAMRAGEILSLSRESIDYERRVAILTDTKNNDNREVPLSNRAVDLLKKVDPDYFTVSSEVHSQLFRRAVGNAGIEDLRFHDSRAAGLMKLSKKVDVLTLARIVGHRDIKSLMIYYRVKAEDIAKLLD